MAAAPGSRYPIRAVAKLTGLSIDTLRAWERRYEAVTPGRDDRGRVYSGDDIARLTQLARLVDSGHAIGRIAGLSNAALHKLRADSPDRHAPAPAADLAPLLAALKRYDLPAIESILNRHVVSLPPRDLIFLVVLPTLRDLGDLWAAGTIRPAQEHLVSAIVRSVLGGLLRTLPGSRRGKTMVMATPSGEHHELGLLAAAVLAAAAGIHVIYLGPDLPSADIAHAVAASEADILLLSVTRPATMDRAELRKLSRLAERVEIWAGGPGAASLREAVGTRVRVIARLEDLSHATDRHVA